jgi:hypothetical protein
MAAVETSRDRVKEVEEDEDFLNTDPSIRGQEYVCLSFISPETLLEKKELFFFERFMKMYEAKIRYEMLEKFLAKFADRHNEKLELSIKYTSDCVARELSDNSTDLSGDVTQSVSDIVHDKLSSSKINLAEVFEDFKSYVENNRSAVASKENIVDAYKDFMFTKQRELDDEFHAANDFKTTVRGVKVRGSYGNYKEACVRAKKLQKEDPAHDVFVGQVGYWLPWDPNPNRRFRRNYLKLKRIERSL